MDPQFEVQCKIQRPVAEVFDAVYNPEKLTGYFTTAGASAPLDPGTTVMWEFADFPGAFPVEVKDVIPNEKISFEWQAEKRDYNTQVTITFEPLSNDATLVRISESGWENDEHGRKSSYGNCQGWSQMCACLKAYIEYGINLRKGFY